MREQWGVVHRWDLTEMEFNRLQREIDLLKEQLKEANEVIENYANSKIGFEQEDGRFIVGLADFNGLKGTAIYYDPRPAKKYLENWGVK